MYQKDELEIIAKRAKQKLTLPSIKTAIISNMILTNTRNEIVDKRNAQAAPPNK